jgi:hypothetical protein
MVVTDPLGPVQPSSIEPTKVLDAITGEIEFYRKRQLAVYYFAVVAEVLVVSGERFVKNLRPDLAAPTYLVFFLGVTVFAFVLGGAYARRIWKLRQARAKLLASAGYDPSPLPPHVRSWESPSLLYGLLVALLAAVGALITIFGVAPGSR